MCARCSWHCLTVPWQQPQHQNEYSVLRWGEHRCWAPNTKSVNLRKPWVDERKRCWINTQRQQRWKIGDHIVHADKQSFGTCCQAAHINTICSSCWVCCALTAKELLSASDGNEPRPPPLGQLGSAASFRIRVWPLCSHLSKQTKSKGGNLRLQTVVTKGWGDYELSFKMSRASHNGVSFAGRASEELAIFSPVLFFLTKRSTSRFLHVFLPPICTARKTAGVNRMFYLNHYKMNRLSDHFTWINSWHCFFCQLGNKKNLLVPLNDPLQAWKFVKRDQKMVEFGKAYAQNLLDWAEE